MTATTSTCLKNRPHALYRFYDAHDRLLYVGLTANPGSRWQAHSHDKPWWAQVARVTVEHFDGREEVEAAEVAAIKTEKPLHNVAHNPNCDPLRRKVPVNRGTVAHDEPRLTVAQAADRFRVSASTIRRYFDDGLLNGGVLGGRHRRISLASLDALTRTLDLPLGPERVAALDALRRRNRGEDNG
jgi:excisionase family DNA binding protein